jgi:uncharacterized protein YcbK (DUF882 family)
MRPRAIFFTLLLCMSSLAHAGSRVRPRPAAPPAELFALNRSESFTLRPGPAGGFTKVTMRALARFLRCHHTQRVHWISQRLAKLLYETANHFEFARLEVVAGYRAPRVAKAKGNVKSPHKRGVACDFRVVGVANEVLRDYVRHFPKVGVGYYPNSGFVHLDVRDRTSAFWVDYSGPGQRAKYSATPEDDVRRMAQETDTAAPSEEEGDEPQKEASPGGLAPNLPALVPPSTGQDK